MKKFVILMYFFGFLNSVNQTQAQTITKEEHYVVIGAFAIHNNAIRWTDRANKANFNAQYAMCTSPKLYFVYILASPDKRKAFSMVLKIRAETEYKDAWVYSGKLGEELREEPEVTPVPESEPQPESVVADSVAQDSVMKSVAQDSVMKSVAQDSVMKSVAQDSVMKSVAQDSVMKSVAQDSVADSVAQDSVMKSVAQDSVMKSVAQDSVAKSVAQDSVAKSVAQDSVEESVPEGKPFYFKLVHGNKNVIGEVHVLGTTRATHYQAFNGNEVVYLDTPRNTDKIFIAEVQAPGYRSVELTVDYDEPSVLSSGVGPNNETIILFELALSQRGDYIEFNKVRFYGNSVIFQPESKLELDGLIDLMKEQTKYKIKVHGHSNGKQSRSVLVKGRSDKFFETSTLNTRKTLSAKALTEARANLVKEYLIDQGIAAKRIKIKAEGGGTMIYPQGSILSGYNDRIEVEVRKGE